MAQGYVLKWHGAAIAGKAKVGVVHALTVWGEHVLGEAVKIIPLDEGTLQRSGAASVDPDKLTAAVTFDTPYAVAQHEVVTFRHLNGRQAKYLEKPWLASAKLATDLIVLHVRRATGAK